MRPGNAHAPGLPDKPIKKLVERMKRFQAEEARKRGSRDR